MKYKVNDRIILTQDCRNFGGQIIKKDRICIITEVWNINNIYSIYNRTTKINILGTKSSNFKLKL